MDRDDVTWHGYWTATVTPFDASGRIDDESLRSVVRSAVDCGVHGILCNGSTGEWFSQTAGERRQVAEITVECAKGATPVVVGVTCIRPTDACDLVRHAEEIGADAVMASPPPMARLTTRELHAYYSEIFGATQLPAWIYNFPQDNGRPISLDEIEDLARIDNVVAIKQSTPDLAELIETIARFGDEIRVFGHLLSRLGMALIRSGFGGDGHIGSGLLLGREMPGFFEHVWAGRFDEAGMIADRFEAMMTHLRGSDSDGYNWKFGGMHGSMKAAMALLGQSGGYPRLPKLPVTDQASLNEIAKILADAGLPASLPGRATGT